MGQMLDWDRIRELREEIGEEDCAEVVELFFAEVDDAIARLGRTATLAEREADFHFVKGCALNLGFAGLGLLCEAAERRAAEGTIEDGEVVEVIRAYHASRAAFEAGRTTA